MSEPCGVVRTAEGIDRGLATVGELGDRLAAVDVRPCAEGYGDLASVARVIPPGGAAPPMGPTKGERR